VRIDEHSFRFGKEILAARPELLASVLAVVVNAQESQLRKPSISIGAHLNRELSAEGWKKFRKRQPIFSFFKSRVAVEVEISQREFVYRSLICFLAAYNANKIDVGVLITNTRVGWERIKHKSSGPSYERVLEELEWLRPTLTVPLWIIGLK
jgi:hypothetical protein